MTQQEQIDATEKARQRREAEILLLLLLFLGKAETFTRHAIKIGADPVHAAMSVLSGNPSLSLKGMGISLAKIMVKTHVQAVERVWKTVQVPPSAESPAQEAALARRYAQKASEVVQDIRSRVVDGIRLAESDWGAKGLTTAQKLKTLPDEWEQIEKMLRLKAVAEKAMMEADGAGAWEGSHTPQAKEKIKGFRHVSVLTPTTTAICRPRDGIQLPVDHIYWTRNHPQLHFGCRSLLSILTGDFEIVEPPLGLPPPQDGFGYAPWLTGLMAGPLEAGSPA